MCVEAPAYEVSSLGRVRTRINTGRWGRNAPGKLMKMQMSENGYLFVGLFVDGKQRNFRAGRLVCSAFHGPPPFPSAQAAHWNGDRLDNRSTNLRWVSPSENNADQLRHGTLVCGDRVGNSKITHEQAAEIASKPMRHGEISAYARTLGVSRTSISNIIHGKTWARALKEAVK